MRSDVPDGPDGGSMEPMEYLGTPGREPRRAPRLVLVLLLGLAAGVGGFLWWADTVSRAATDDLVAAYEASAARAAAGERQVQGTVAYASPLIWSTSVPEDVRADLRALVEASAAEVAADLAAISDEAADTLVLPWQEPQLEARRAVLSLIDDQRARFGGIADDASDIDMILADGPLPTGIVLASLRASGATEVALR